MAPVLTRRSTPHCQAALLRRRQPPERTSSETVRVQRLGDLGIRRLSEVLVELADREESLGRVDRDELVCLASEALDPITGNDENREHDLRRAERASYAADRRRSGARRDAVVDEDRSPAGGAAAVELSALRSIPSAGAGHYQ